MVIIIALLVGYLVWIVGKAWIAARDAGFEFDHREGYCDDLRCCDKDGG